MSERLSRKNYQQLPNFVKQPSYDFESCGAGIVHIGIGAFHRGHQAVYTELAMSISGGDWRINAVSLRSASVSEQLLPQDCLYTVSEKTEDNSNTFVVGAIKDVLVAPQDPEKVIDIIASNQTKVLTITVTEKGYYYDLSAEKLLIDNPDIQHDIAHIESPKSMPGFLVSACLKRMQGAAAHKLTVISCDNLPHNGEVTRKVVLGLAEQISSELVQWINKNVSFCSSMVDRIVPAVTDEQRESMALKFGISDEAMIETESFKQWVIEDNFCTPVPDWAAAGALIVDDVEQYEKLKLRTLNGSHSCLAYMGVLLGYDYIHQAISDETLLRTVQGLMKNETGPSLKTPQGIDLAKYQQDIIARFQNDNIAYKTQQVAMDGSQKMIQRIFAPLQDNLDADNPRQCKLLVAVVASWLFYLRGKNEKGQEFAISDPKGSELNKLANHYFGQPDDMIETLFDLGIFPDGLKTNDRFSSMLKCALDDIKQHGLRHHLLTLLDAP